MSQLPKETITVKNFGGMADVTIDIAPINIFIGPQGTGKSVCAKLIYFCRRILKDIVDEVMTVSLGKRFDLNRLDATLAKRFVRFFPSDAWPAGDFHITYVSGGLEVQIHRSQVMVPNHLVHVKHDKLQMAVTALSDSINNLALEGKLDTGFSRIHDTFFEAFKDVPALNQLERQYYVPAERAYYWLADRTLYASLDRDAVIDPFLVIWGAHFAQVRGQTLGHIETDNNNHPKQDRIDQLYRDVIGAFHKQEFPRNFLHHDDGRTVPLEHASSGQQCAVPIGLVVKDLIFYTRIFGGSLLVEEPELHLYPNAQRLVVESLVLTHNESEGDLQLIITTHSPYVLSIFNNFLQAGELARDLPGEYRARIDELVPPEVQLAPGTVQAFHFEDGKVTPLVDDESGLIGADRLDQLSEDLSVQFSELLEVAWKARNSATAKN